MLLVFGGFCSLLVSFFRGNLISISCYFQLLTDHVSHLSGNAGKKKEKKLVPVKSPCRTSARRFTSSYLRGERSRNSNYAADLNAKVCHLHMGRLVETMNTEGKYPAGHVAQCLTGSSRAPWTSTKAEKLQLSVFLPNDLS